MKRWGTVAAGAALVLVMASCGSSESGTAAPVGSNTTPVVPTVETPVVPTIEIPTMPEIPTELNTPTELTPPTLPTESTETSEQTLPTESSAAPGGELDEATYNWFSTMCTGLQEMMAMGSALQNFQTDPNDPDGAINAAVGAIRGVATEVGDVATELDIMPSPSLEGGEQMSSAFVGLFRGLSEGLLRAVEHIDGLDPTDLAAAQTALAAFQAELETTMSTYDPVAALAGIPEPDPAVWAAIQSIPGCDAL